MQSWHISICTVSLNQILFSVSSQKFTVTSYEAKSVASTRTHTLHLTANLAARAQDVRGHVTVNKGQSPPTVKGRTTHHRLCRRSRLNFESLSERETPWTSFKA